MTDDVDLLRQVTSLGSLGGEPLQNEYTGTKALMVAVLENGLRTCCGPAGQLRTEAEDWVRSNRRSAFSFTVICETLALEPDAVRRALRRLQTEPLPRRIRPMARKHQPVAK